MASLEQSLPLPKTLRIALLGQPNTGKSTVFNRLTGSRQHVGNWPGKTVEQKTGVFYYAGKHYSLVDLPGTYSLTANSLEERISRDYIIEEQPDLVVVMVDASQMERTLYILSELIMLPVPVILALNMMDVAEEQERKIDIMALEEACEKEHIGC
jgi:ferrous iron transport protein B